MKIYLGSDHAGLTLKNEIIKHLQNLGHEIKDYGTYTLDSCDYPDFAYPTAKSVAEEKDSIGILVCYTGIGMSMSANKVLGIRAALVGSVENAHLTREHNNANILCLGAKDVPVPLAIEIVDEFINTEFAGGRHERRVNKINAIERQ